MLNWAPVKCALVSIFTPQLGTVTACVCLSICSSIRNPGLSHLFTIAKVVMIMTQWSKAGKLEKGTASILHPQQRAEVKLQEQRSLKMRHRCRERDKEGQICVLERTRVAVRGMPPPPKSRSEGGVKGAAAQAQK